MGLLLHVDSENVQRDELKGLPVPQATRTWQPIGHFRFEQMLRAELESFGIEITNSAYGLSKPDEDGYRHKLFGLFQTQDQILPKKSHMLVGFRNSTDMTLSAGVCFGSRVLVCDNRAFSGAMVFRRKHTLNILNDLPGLITKAVSRYQEQFNFQRRLFERLQEVELSRMQVHDLMIQAAASKVVSYSALSKVRREWLAPSHEDFLPRTAWSLYNAFTEEMKYVPEAAIERTIRLTGLFRRRFLGTGAQENGRSTLVAVSAN